MDVIWRKTEAVPGGEYNMYRRSVSEKGKVCLGHAERSGVPQQEEVRWVKERFGRLAEREGMEGTGQEHTVAGHE